MDDYADDYKIELNFPNRVTRVFNINTTRKNAYEETIRIFNEAVNINGTKCRINVTLRDGVGTALMNLRC